MPLKKRLLLPAVLAGALCLGTTTVSEAQTHVVVGVHGGYGFHGGFYYASPFWYGYPWWGFGWGVGWPYYGYPYPYPYAYPYYYSDGSLRLQVTPKEAQVYVDGYYAGIVDNFSGVFQKLHVPLGQHEITLYLDGYRTAHQTVHMTADTFKIKFAMEKLAAGDVAEPPPQPPANPPPTAQGYPRQDQEAPPPPPFPGPPIGNGPPPSREGGVPRTVEASTSGALSIRVQPDQAVVLIDGERWQGPEGQERLVVSVPSGSHRIEVQKEGYDSFSTLVVVRAGETLPLNVSLRTH